MPKPSNKYICPADRLPQTPAQPGGWPQTWSAGITFPPCITHTVTLLSLIKHFASHVNRADSVVAPWHSPHGSATYAPAFIESAHSVRSGALASRHGTQTIPLTSHVFASASWNMKKKKKTNGGQQLTCDSGNKCQAADLKLQKRQRPVSAPVGIEKDICYYKSRQYFCE